jgi:hypothetical protein
MWTDPQVQKHRLKKQEFERCKLQGKESAYIIQGHKSKHLGKSLRLEQLLLQCKHECQWMAGLQSKKGCRGSLHWQPLQLSCIDKHHPTPIPNVNHPQWHPWIGFCWTKTIQSGGERPCIHVHREKDREKERQKRDREVEGTMLTPRVNRHARRLPRGKPEPRSLAKGHNRQACIGDTTIERTLNCRKAHSRTRVGFCELALGFEQCISGFWAEGRSFNRRRKRPQ